MADLNDPDKQDAPQPALLRKKNIRPPSLVKPTDPVSSRPTGEKPLGPPVKPLIPSTPVTPSKLAAHALDPTPVKRDVPPEVREETPRIADPPEATATMSDISPMGRQRIGARPLGAPPAQVAKRPAPELVESVSTLFCWALLCVSAALLTIQLWTYFS